MNLQGCGPFILMVVPNSRQYSGFCIHSDMNDIELEKNIIQFLKIDPSVIHKFKIIYKKKIIKSRKVSDCEFIPNSALTIYIRYNK